MRGAFSFDIYFSLQMLLSLSLLPTFLLLACAQTWTLQTCGTGCDGRLVTGVTTWQATTDFCSSVGCQGEGSGSTGAIACLGATQPTPPPGLIGYKTYGNPTCQGEPTRINYNLPECAPQSRSLSYRTTCDGTNVTIFHYSNGKLVGATH